MYYGSHKIKEIQELSDGHVRISFHDEVGENEEVVEVNDEYTSKELLEAVQTEEASDATELSDKRIEVMLNDVTKVLAYHNMYLSETDKIGRGLGAFLQDTLAHADKIAWGVEDHEKSIRTCNRLINPESFRDPE